ncbi:MAG: twitching motility two-component system response regulator PilH [Phormidesmis priestleyi Ana]|uniref:Twitching motility two-component system response regulator PilH n=1 Tax=Phormidesmis priestleyi Ana TaxID=1666911 RepID=A0A0P7ZSD1_9CYAN|nr:MAG: twitching motility two-component system response regulator PilH [Phormidesmis priestleyi Ana]
MIDTPATVLPMTLNSPPAHQTATQPATQVPAKVSTVLVVEDTPSEMELMSHYLREEGFSVISAPSGKEGLDKAIAQQPDIIITDVVMPGISGFELCRKLKRTPETMATPIVICSSKKQNIDRLWGLKQGAKAYLTKPYTRDELVEVIKTALV